MTGSYCKLCKAKNTVLPTSQVKSKSELYYGSSASSGQVARKIGENKAIGKVSAKASALCENCHGRTNQPNAKLCHTCAYKEGKCVHGKKMLDTKGYTMSNR